MKKASRSTTTHVPASEDVGDERVPGNIDLCPACIHVQINNHEFCMNFEEDGLTVERRFVLFSSSIIK